MNGGRQAGASARATIWCSQRRVRWNPGIPEAQPSLTERRPWGLKTSFCPYLPTKGPGASFSDRSSTPIAKYRHPCFAPATWSRFHRRPALLQLFLCAREIWNEGIRARLLEASPVLGGGESDENECDAPFLSSVLTDFSGFRWTSDSSLVGRFKRNNFNLGVVDRMNFARNRSRNLNYYSFLVRLVRIDFFQLI